MHIMHLAQGLAQNRISFPSLSFLFFPRGPTLYQMAQPPYEGAHKFHPPWLLLL